METAHTRKMTIGAMLFVFALVAVMCLFVNTPKASAVTAADLQAEASSVSAQLSSWQNQLDAASDSYYSALSEHDAAVQGMNDAQAKIDEAEAKKATLQGHLSTRAKSMYRTGSTSFIDVLLGASSINDLVTTVDTLNNLNEEDISYVDQAKAAQQEAEDARAEYATQEQTANEKLNEATQVQAEAQATVSEYQAKVNSLDSQVATLVSQEQAAANGTATVTTGTTTDGGDGTAAGSTSGSADSSSDGGGSYSSGGVYEGGSDAVSRAYACLGAPYVWGATGPEAYDCSGLVSYCITGSHSRVFTSNELSGYAEVGDPQPGDVCVTRGGGHCGIYIGGGQMIHAATEGVGVVSGPVQSEMKIVRP